MTLPGSWSQDPPPEAPQRRRSPFTGLHPVAQAFTVVLLAVFVLAAVAAGVACVAVAVWVWGALT